MVDVARVEELVTPIVVASGHRVHDVTFGGRTLRIAIDGDDGVPLEDIERLSRQLSVLLDEHDPVPGAYTLEVSSPGVERPLRRPDHFRAAVGSTVTINERTPEGTVRHRGVLRDATDTEVVVAPGDADPDDAAQRVAYRDITSARTVFEWGPTPPPGGGSKRSKKKKASS